MEIIQWCLFGDLFLLSALGLWLVVLLFMAAGKLVIGGSQGERSGI